MINVAGFDSSALQRVLPTCRQYHGETSLPKFKGKEILSQIKIWLSGEKEM